MEVKENTLSNVVIRFAGDSGDGMQLTGAQFAAAVAREGYDACMAGTPVYISGLPYELTVYWERLQPRWLVRRLGSLLSKRFQKTEPTPRKRSRKSLRR